MQANLQKILKRYNIRVSESVVSMVLGAVVVIALAVLAYNYFRSTNQPSVPPPPEIEEIESGLNGEIGTAGAAVALPVTHEVRTGETLWSIAEKYYRSGYNFMDIAVANSLADPKQIEVGQKLTIPNVAVREPLTVSEIKPAVTVSRIEGNSYLIAKGDNLWMIAVRAYGDGFRWPEIVKANNLANPDLIHPGNILTIPR